MRAGSTDAGACAEPGSPTGPELNTQNGRRDSSLEKRRNEPAGLNASTELPEFPFGETPPPAPGHRHDRRWQRSQIEDGGGGLGDRLKGAFAHPSRRDDVVARG